MKEKVEFEQNSYLKTNKSKAGATRKCTWVVKKNNCRCKNFWA